MGSACTDCVAPSATRRQRNHARATIGEPCAGKPLARFERRMGNRACSPGTAPLTTNACTAGDLVETLTVDLEGLTGIRLEVRTSDGSTATTGSLVEARNGQSGVVGIEVLRGVYELVAKQGAGKLVVDPIDCSSGPAFIVV